MYFADESVITEASKRKNLMVLKTLSKSFGCASIRVGFAVSSKENVDVIKTLKSPYNLNSISQVIGEIILKNKPLAKKRVESIKASRDVLYEGLSVYNDDNFKVYPTHANFVYVKTARAKEIADNLLQKGIVVRCFSGALRISAGLPEEVDELLSAMRDILK
jgi:histidinol-phosphate aminotransferase